MIYICTHKQPKYQLSCQNEVVMASGTELAQHQHLRQLRGIYEIWKHRDWHHESEVGIFQYRRSLEVCTIPEWYECVAPYDYMHFNCYDQYARYHRIADLDALIRTADDSAFEHYLKHDNMVFMHNMMILRPYMFDQYCSFMFGLLGRYESDGGSPDAMPFLAERIGSYWIWKNCSTVCRSRVKVW